MFARAGKSYSRSSSSYSSSRSSSSSYSRPAQSYSRPTYTRPATPPPRAVAPVARPQTVINRTTINRTTVNRSNDSGGGNYNNRNNNDNGNNNGGGSGMGIMGTIAGVGGGIVVGNLLTSALMGDHRNAGHAPAGGYASTPAGYPVAGQPVAPAMAGATSGNYVTDGQGGYTSAPTEASQSGLAPVSGPAMGNELGATPAPATVIEEKSNGFLTWLMWFLGATALIAIGVVLIRKYLTYRARQKEIEEMIDAEANISKFEQIFKTIQSSYESGARVNLIKLMTMPMYNTIMETKSLNEEKGLTNIMDGLQIHSVVNQSAWVDDGIKYQQVKIRFSMIDYVVNEKEELIHGSKDKRETAVELWTFQSSSKDDWILSRIDQHGGYVHQV